MRRLNLLIIIAMSAAVTGCESRDAHNSPSAWLRVPGIDEVMVNDGFWSPKIALNREKTIPYVFQKCEETGRIDNFAIAGGLKQGKYSGERYNDSDVFKAVEGACYSLIQAPDPSLRKYVDSLVTLFEAAQEDDDYLYTTRTIDPVNMAPGAGRERWIDERVSHELYNLGHMYEAAVAHYRATGSDRFLKIALKNAALVESQFGWGRREIAPGHQEIEIGLIKLYGVTGDNRWLDLAKFFIDVRGRGGDYVRHPAGSRFEVYNDSVYLQMHKPVHVQDQAVGHAVRGAYMYTALADLSRETGDMRYLETSEKIWKDVAEGKIYITGGIGSKEYGEAFGEPFELPNMTAYTETCASVANVFWNHRLFNATGDSKYLDVLERTLYNGLISGIGADGCNFFYPNPLESDGSFERSGWFDCSCCPVNIARFMPTIGSYIYSVSDNAVYVNLFIGSEARLKVNGEPVSLKMETDMPWKGNVKVSVTGTGAGSGFSIRVRIPSWTGEAPVPGNLYRFITPATGRVRIAVNGKEIQPETVKGFAVIDREWSVGDVITVNLPAEPRFIAARDEVEADRDRIALSAGPVVYCLEEADNGKVRGVKADPAAGTLLTDLLTGEEGKGTLMFDAKMPDGSVKMMRAVPYYSWANRGRGEMIVWMKTK